MKGYCNFSKSNNAVFAEKNGIFPISRAAKIIARKYNVTQKKAKAWLLENWGGEWHHYSKFYNETPVYNTDLEQEEINDLLNFQLKEEKVETKKAQFIIKWIEWEGTRRHPKAIHRSFTGEAEIKGRWIYFDNKRKSLDGNHIEIKELLKK